LHTAHAQARRQYEVHTFDRVDQQKVARDRAAMAEADRLKRERWAAYQAQLARQQQEALNAAATAARERERVASVAARKRFQAELNNQRRAVSEEPIVHEGPPSLVVGAKAPRRLAWARFGIYALSGVAIAFAAWLFSLYGRMSTRNPQDWRLAAVVVSTIALVLGSAALIGAWIPLFGLATVPTAVTGAALAILGWLIGRKAQGCETIMPQIAGIICAASLLLTLVVHTLLARGVVTLAEGL